MRAIVGLVLIVAVAGLLAFRAEPLAPSATLDRPVDVLGRATPLALTVHDRGTGLRRVEVRLVPDGGGDPVVLAAQDFPRTSFFGSGVKETTLTPTVDASTAKLPEGPARLEVAAVDHSWLAGLRNPVRLTHPVTVDVTPPRLEVLTNQHTGRLGGTELVVYRAGDDAVASGVEIAGRTAPGTPGLFADATLRAAMFPLPSDGPGARPLVFAVDAAGNRSEARIDIVVKDRKFPEKTLAISDAFLDGKVTDLLRAAGLDPTGEPAARYRRVNTDLRRTTEARIRELTTASAATPLWEGAFLRMPNAAPLAGFADQRAYTYDGQVIDHSTHLGFDLASLKGSPVPAANAGHVVFAGPLAIYGNAVIIDHGLGLFSLYGHLSEVGVKPEQQVARGEVIGKTGETGLAGGDHLHFGMLVRGTYVDPVEWWDGHWITDHINRRLVAFPRAGAAAGTTPNVPPSVAIVEKHP